MFAGNLNWGTGGISDRGVWEMGDDREMLDVRVESMRGER